jgi:peptidoglycan/LPS O-acetylase OafA/YrhL
MVLEDSLAGRARLSLIYWLDDFLAGFLLADLFATATDREHRSFAWDAASLIGWPTVVASQWNETTYHLLAPAAMVAYVGACRGRASHWVLSRPLIVVIGGMCYTIYLYHFYVISLVGREALPLTAGLSYPSAFAVMAVVVVPPVLLASVVLFRIFERPFMAWKPWKVEERSRIVEPVRFETSPELLAAPSGLATSEAHRA